MSDPKMFDEAFETLINMMKVKLAANKHKGTVYKIDWLYNQLLVECQELKESLLDKNRYNSISECADIGNFAMMIIYCLLEIHHMEQIDKIKEKQLLN